MHSELDLKEKQNLTRAHRRQASLWTPIAPSKIFLQYPYPASYTAPSKALLHSAPGSCLIQDLGIFNLFF
jgi:hypothetical protein